MTALAVVPAVGQLVPVVPEPQPTAGDNASWDAFWAEKRGAGTTVIRGVEVRIPTSLTLAADEELTRRAEESTDSSWRAVLLQLLRAPDGSVIPDLWERWTVAGMERDEMHVLGFWALARARGEAISFAEAHDRLTAVTEGRGEGKAPTSGDSPAASGGPSKRRSSRRTGSAPTTSPA